MVTSPTQPTTTTEEIAAKFASSTVRTMNRRDTRSATIPPGMAQTRSPAAFAAATTDSSSGPPPAEITA
jgi:hypothetical protein